MNILYTIKRTLILLAFALPLAACGNGDDVPATTTQAVVSISLTGSDTSLAGSVRFDLTLPDGFTLATDDNGDLAAGVLDSQVAESIVEGNYLSETTLSIGQVNANGLPAGVILTLTRTMAEGETLPAVTDFTIGNLQISDGGYYLTGYVLELAIEERTVN